MADGTQNIESLSARAQKLDAFTSNGHVRTPEMLSQELTDYSAKRLACMLGLYAPDAKPTKLEQT